MPPFVQALTENPGCPAFRIEARATKDPTRWELRPLPSDIPTTSDGSPLLLRAFHISDDNTIVDAVIDLHLPERNISNVYRLKSNSVEATPRHEILGELIPAVALCEYGCYELYYSRIAPEIGIEVLRKGLQRAPHGRRGPIAEDLGYILHDEDRIDEAIQAFLIAANEGPSGPAIFEELSQLRIKEENNRRTGIGERPTYLAASLEVRCGPTSVGFCTLLGYDRSMCAAFGPLDPGPAYQQIRSSVHRSAALPDHHFIPPGAPDVFSLHTSKGSVVAVDHVHIEDLQDELGTGTIEIRVFGLANADWDALVK